MSSGGLWHERPMSSNNLNKWPSEIDSYTTENINKIFVGNKCNIFQNKFVDLTL